MLVVLLISTALSASCLEPVSSENPPQIPEFVEQIFYSGRDGNDLGRYEECIDLGSLYYLVLFDYKSTNTHIGLCVPSSCSPDDIKQEFIFLINSFNLSSQISIETIKIYDSHKYSNEGMSFSAISVVILLVLILLLNCLGTYADMSSVGDKIFIGKLLTEFSLRKNYYRILKTPTKTENLTAIYGIKVFAIVGIIIYTCFDSHFRISIGNPEDATDMQKDLKHKFVVMMRSAVCVFMIISGFLLSYLILPELMRQQRSYSWGKFVLARFLRLSPLYYSVFMIDAFLFRYIGKGSQWPLQEQRSQASCKSYWWANFLYLNDFIPYSSLPCMPWSWYVAVDLHLFMIAPLMLIFYMKNKTWGYLICVFFMFCNFLYIGVVATSFGFSPSFYKEKENESEVALLWLKPQSWLSVFFIGVVFGLIYINHKEK